MGSVWPLAGELALVIKSGAHNGHTLRSAEDEHLALSPIAVELIFDAENNPGGFTVNLTQRATLVAMRQLNHREITAVLRLNNNPWLGCY